jgi:bacteriophage exclusion system BrxB-like protein
MKEGLGGEIPFFIQPFHPEHQVAVDKQVRHLIKRLGVEGIDVLEINLFQLCINILKEQNIFEMSLDSEKEQTKNEFLEALRGPLNIEEEVIPHLKKLIANENSHIVFLTGIGSVFPIIRSHTILNNLQKLIKQVPLVMFFPGDYNNLSLSIFGKLTDENYYRALNLNDYKI